VRVLVTGGRTYNDQQAVNLILSRVHAKKPITLLVHGDADGADTLAKQWATDHGIEHKPFPITKEEWERYGNRAGRRRNTIMFNASKPDLVVSFPGGDGTHHMELIAIKAGTRLLQSRKFLAV
jgi:hypothetical protein